MTTAQKRKLSRCRIFVSRTVVAVVVVVHIFGLGILAAGKEGESPLGALTFLSSLKLGFAEEKNILKLYGILRF